MTRFTMIPAPTETTALQASCGNGDADCRETREIELPLTGLAATWTRPPALE